MGEFARSGKRVSIALAVIALLLLTGQSVGRRGLHVAAQTSTGPKPRSEPSADQQAISVTVPAGSLSVSLSSDLVVLRRMGAGNGRSIYRGSLPTVRVIDTRGSLPGWHAYVSFSSGEPSEDLEGSILRVRPGNPVAVFGERQGVTKAQASWTRLARNVSLFRADMGSGRGTYEDGADLELALPPSSTFTASSVTLYVSVTVL